MEAAKDLKEVVHASVAEIAQFNEMQAELARKLSESHRKELGRLDSLRAGILGMVVEENYDRAKEELAAYVDVKTEFPAFQDRVKRLVTHCCELIQAVATKRNFPGLNGLSLSKQQEIHERVLEHFEDLKAHLIQIERIEREHKLDDVRSTVWVLRTMVNVVALIAVVGFVTELADGTGETLYNVVGVYLDMASNWLVAKLPL